MMGSGPQSHPPHTPLVSWAHHPVLELARVAVAGVAGPGGVRTRGGPLLLRSAECQRGPAEAAELRHCLCVVWEPHFAFEAQPTQSSRHASAVAAVGTESTPKESSQCYTDYYRIMRFKTGMRLEFSQLSHACQNNIGPAPFKQLGRTLPVWLRRLLLGVQHTRSAASTIGEPSTPAQCCRLRPRL